MSWLAQAWAEIAPVKNVYERALLTLMSHRANHDGTGCYPSKATMARYALCDTTTVKRHLHEMARRGLIGPGNQKLVAHLPANKRPNVYDLLVPFSFYSADQLVDVQRQRAENNLPPLTAEMRPPIAKPESTGRKTRTDKGVPRQPKTAKAAGSGSSEAESGDEEGDTGQGGLTDPPTEPGDGDEPGGSKSPLQGGLRVPARGVYQSPKHVPLQTRPSKQSRGGRKAAPHTPASRSTTGHSESVVTTELKYVVTSPVGEIGQTVGQVESAEPRGNWSSWGLVALQAELAKRIDREAVFSTPGNAQAIREITREIEAKGGNPELAYVEAGAQLAEAAANEPHLAQDDPADTTRRSRSRR